MGCCCANYCCWDKCTFSAPPDDCVANVPNAQWIYSEDLGYFQAFQTKLPTISLVNEVYNKPQQLWSRVTNVEDTQFALKNGELYLTVQMNETGISSLKVEEAKYSN